jgi:hypothetical protein
MTIREDALRLIDDPDFCPFSTYHDAGSCWELIDELRQIAREHREALRKCRDNISEYSCGCFDESGNPLLTCDRCQAVAAADAVLVSEGEGICERLENQSTRVYVRLDQSGGLP